MVDKPEGRIKEFLDEINRLTCGEWAWYPSYDHLACVHWIVLGKTVELAAVEPVRLAKELAHHHPEEYKIGR